MNKNSWSTDHIPLERPSHPAKLVALFTRLKQINERIDNRVSREDVKEDFLLRDFHETKLKLLETILLDYANEDFRILPHYFPQYLNTLGKLSRYQHHQEKETERLSKLTKILDILASRSTKMIIDLEINRYFEQNMTAHFPSDTPFGSEYSNRVSGWYIERYTTVELLEQFIKTHSLDTETSKKNCEFLFRTLSNQIHEGETTESYLNRQAAIVFLHLELSYHPDGFDTAFENLSFIVEQNSSVELTLSESYQILYLLSLSRVAQLISDLNRTPSAAFFGNVITCYLEQKSLDSENTSSPLSMIPPEQHDLLRSLFEQAVAENATFLDELREYFAQSNEPELFNPDDLPMSTTAEFQLLLDPILQSLSFKEAAVPTLPKYSHVSTVTLGVTERKPQIKDVQTLVKILSDTTNTVQLN